MDNQIFVDTGGFKALIDANDDFHKRATKIWEFLQESNCTLVTTNYILDESFTLIRIRCGGKVVQSFRQVLARSPNLKVVRVTVADEAGAWNWFTKDWSKLSYTDCTSFAVMGRLGLKRVMTFDHHFQQAGFKME